MPDSTAIRGRGNARIFGVGSGHAIAARRPARVSGLRLLQIAAMAAAFGLILVITFA